MIPFAGGRLLLPVEWVETPEQFACHIRDEIQYNCLILLEIY